MKRLSFVLAAMAVMGSGQIAAADINTEGLARSCNACHGLNGVSVGPSMPSIAGQPEAYLRNVMMQWKSDERYSATMGRHFKGYSDAELAALATYFSKLPYVPTAQKADDKVVAQGKAATDRCETCHGATGGEPDDAETPKLNGQWAQYLEMELMKYRNDAAKMPHKKMRNNAKKLADEDVAAVARYYAAQPK
jgi:cytochrome subunit of sulfide dehydrogenase